jgi:oxalate decarboxylase
VRELHWHKAPSGLTCSPLGARSPAVERTGRNFVDDVGVGDGWYFPSGFRTRSRAGPDGCEFLLVFDDGDFDEDNTFLLSDWLKHIPPDVLAKNFGVPACGIRECSRSVEALHFPRAVPGPIARTRSRVRRNRPQDFSHR